MWQYSKKLLEHFRNPKNWGEMNDPDGTGKAGNPVCGDQLVLYIKVGKKNGKEMIKDIKFQTLGCPAAIGVSSMITEMAKRKTLEKAKKITSKDVVDAIGKLPPIKMHCSNLGAEALHKAIEDYEKKKGGK